MKCTRLWILLIILHSSFFSSAQTDSCNLRISLLTCSPGEELYSSFGHTAIRVTDLSNGSDLVFNYGTFDMSDPITFYMEFTQGLMMYALSVYPFRAFQVEYSEQNRGVVEQVLQLTCEERQKLYAALRVNAQEANRYYEYYFLNDNCTTRAKDMIVKSAPGISFGNILPPDHPTFRNMIHSYLDKSGQPWSKFGIDILLGSRLDKKVTNEQSMFLPDYLLEGFDTARIAARPLVSSKQTVLEYKPLNNEAPAFTPLLFFTVLLLIVAALTFLGTKWAQQLMNIFDRIFFFTLGLLGLLLLTLWIIRLDTVCRDNFNLLWALPTHLYIAFVMGRNKKWIKKYFRITLIISGLTLLSWFFLPQQLNTALIPVLLIIITRSFFRSKKP
jgi:Domain of unknown function (DUF4105)